MIHIRSKIKPIKNMVLIGIFPVPKAIVFGAVATGNINPTEAAKVAGNIITKGSTFKTGAKLLKQVMLIEWMQC